MEKYRLINKIGQGTFSYVFKSLSIEDNRYVAIKRMKKKFDTYEQAIDHQQIKALKSLCPYDHIVQLYQVIYDQQTHQLNLVFELMEQNLYEAIIRNHKANFSQYIIKIYMYKILKSIAYMHGKGLFHRDIKPENILISGDQIKLADFGTAKKTATTLPYTEYIATRWYRPPQCLLTDGYYGPQMDIWGFSCVLFELITKYPLFNGKNQIDQINKINKILGSPSESLIARFKPNASHMKAEDWNFQYHKGINFSRLLPYASEELADFLSKTIVYDPKNRLTAEEALKHPYFQGQSPNKTIQKLVTQKTERKQSKQSLNFKQKTDKGYLPPIHQIKMELKVGKFNQSLGMKLKKPLWYKFNGHQKH